MCEVKPLRMTKGAAEILAAIAERNRMVAERTITTYSEPAEPPAYIGEKPREPVYAGR